MKHPKVSKLVATIDGADYEVRAAGSCIGCHFINECYAEPRKMTCPLSSVRTSMAAILKPVNSEKQQKNGGTRIFVEKGGKRYRVVGSDNVTDMLRVITFGKGSFYADCVREEK